MMSVVAAGMSSSLGPATTACAAHRAGLVRARPSEEVFTFAPGDREPQPVSIREAAGSTFGFMGVGRLVALACGALEDLRTHVSLETLGREAGVFIALPDFSDGSSAEQVVLAAQHLGRQCLTRALAGLGVSWPQERWRFFGGGSAGFAQALVAARGALEQRVFDTCVVGGIDSLVEPGTLRGLLASRRLKTADNPVGLVPGEAGAFLVLRRGQGEGASTSGLAGIAAISMGHEPNHVLAGPRPDGRALATCVRKALAETPVGDGEVLFITDLNGEERRAWEWGCASVLLKGEGGVPEETPFWVPASGFGDLGAASSAVAACLARHAFWRRHTRASRIVVVSQSDSGGRAAFTLLGRHAVRTGGRS